MSDQEPDVIDTIRGLLKRQRPWAAADLALACIQQMRNEAEEVAKEALGIMKADEQRIAELEKDRDGLGEELGEIRRLAGTAIHPPDETAAGLKSRITGLEERAEKAERGIRDALVALDPGDDSAETLVEIRVAGGVYLPDRSAAAPAGTGDRTRRDATDRKACVGTRRGRRGAGGHRSRVHGAASR